MIVRHDDFCSVKTIRNASLEHSKDRAGSKAEAQEHSKAEVQEHSKAEVQVHSKPVEVQDNKELGSNCSSFCSNRKCQRQRCWP